MSDGFTSRSRPEDPPSFANIVSALHICVCGGVYMHVYMCGVCVTVYCKEVERIRSGREKKKNLVGRIEVRFIL